MLSYICCH